MLPANRTHYPHTNKDTLRGARLQMDCKVTKKPPHNQIFADFFSTIIGFPYEKEFFCNELYPVAEKKNKSLELGIYNYSTTNLYELLLNEDLKVFFRNDSLRI